MLSERDAVVRQSSVLLSSAASDQRLMKALQDIDDLTKKLKVNEHKHSSQVWRHQYFEQVNKETPSSLSVLTSDLQY